MLDAILGLGVQKLVEVVCDVVVALEGDFSTSLDLAAVGAEVVQDGEASGPLNLASLKPLVLSGARFRRHGEGRSTIPNRLKKRKLGGVCQAGQGKSRTLAVGTVRCTGSKLP